MEINNFGAVIIDIVGIVVMFLMIYGIMLGGWSKGKKKKKK